MRKIKGCGNESCEAHKKKITYKDSETFCSKCGDSLVYICKDCYTQLPDDTEKYCVRCLAAHDDRNDKAKKVAAGGVLAVGGVMLKFGKNVLDVVKMVKG